MEQNFNVNYFSIQTKLLVLAIERAHLNPSKLAYEIGIAKNTIYRILNHHTIPSLPVVQLISERLALSDEEILQIFLAKQKENN